MWFWTTFVLNFCICRTGPLAGIILCETCWDTELNCQYLQWTVTNLIPLTESVQLELLHNASRVDSTTMIRTHTTRHLLFPILIPAPKTTYRRTLGSFEGCSQWPWICQFLLSWECLLSKRHPWTLLSLSFSVAVTTKVVSWSTFGLCLSCHTPRATSSVRSVWQPSWRTPSKPAS